MRTPSPTADMAAIGLSSLCVIHCLALPALAVTLPLAGSLSEVEWLHRLLVLLTVPISAYVFLSPITHPRRGVLRGLATLGSALLLLGAFAEPLHDHETVLTVAGALCLAVAHGLRVRFQSHVHTL